jgi:hypothetical protein
VSEAPNDYWRRFDLADTFLLSGESVRGVALYREAMVRVPAEHRRSVFTTAAGPLQELLAAGVLAPEAEDGVRQVTALLQTVAGTR